MSSVFNLIVFKPCSLKGQLLILLGITLLALSHPTNVKSILDLDFSSLECNNAERKQLILSIDRYLDIDEPTYNILNGDLNCVLDNKNNGVFFTSIKPFILMVTKLKAISHNK
jgi:hypothetical protein